MEFEQIYKSLDRIETKLDTHGQKLEGHLGRLSSLETKVQGQQGWIKLSITMILGIVSTFISWIAAHTTK